MALPAYALVSLTELKAFYPSVGTALDAEMERVITRASRRIEEHLDRRIVYRAPTTSEAQVYSGNWANGSPAVGAQPNAAGRTLVVTFTSATGGTLTVTGTVAGVVGITEVFDAANGVSQYGAKFFTAISGQAIAGALGGGTVTIGTSQGYTEFHSPRGESELAPIEWPIAQVIEVNEDLNLTYAAATALTAGTEYVVRQGSSVLRRVARISNLLDFAFYSGHRVVRLRYSAGYFGTANVPATLKEVALRLAALGLSESINKRVGISSASDALGNFTRFGPATLTDSLKEDLAAFERGSFGWAAERDFDLEAA